MIEAQLDAERGPPDCTPCRFPEASTGLRNTLAGDVYRCQTESDGALRRCSAWVRLTLTVIRSVRLAATLCTRDSGATRPCRNDARLHEMRTRLTDRRCFPNHGNSHR